MSGLQWLLKAISGVSYMFMWFLFCPFITTLKILFFQEFTAFKYGLFTIGVCFQNRNKIDGCSANSECLKASFEGQLFICHVSWIFTHLLIGLHSSFLLLSSLFSC